MRSGTLIARCLSKRVAAARLKGRRTVHLAHGASNPEPAAVLVDTRGTGTMPEERIEAGIREAFPLTRFGTFRYSNHGRPIYREGAAFG